MNIIMRVVSVKHPLNIPVILFPLPPTSTIKPNYVHMSISGYLRWGQTFDCIDAATLLVRERTVYSVY